ncbi:MAG: glycosyltransferase [Promethearchaeota archaeon]
MKKIKIAVIASGNIPSKWAHGINTIKHAEYFFKNGCVTEILTIKRFMEYINLYLIKNIHQFYGIPKKIKFKFFLDNSFYFFSNIHFLRYFYTKLRYKILRINNFLDPEKKVSDYCKRNKFDLTYCRTYRTAYYNIKRRIPSIIESHNYLLNLDLSKLLELSKNPYFISLVTISEQLKARFLRLGVPAEKILVLEDAVDLDKFEAIRESKESLKRKLKLPINKKIILYAGNLSEDRDIATILEAADLLNSPTFSFYFIGGSRTEIRHWKHYINKRGFQADIHFLGFQPPRVIPHYLKAADVLLATYSPRCLTLKWMSPLKLFEYMASRTPIIASRIGRIPEICSNGEVLFVEPENALNLSEKIIFLLESKSIHQTLIEKAFKKASEHTYLKRCETILNFCNCI